MSDITPRGMRNNNPGNLDRDGTAWDGLAQVQTDPRFCQFITPTYGIRALAKVLISYQDAHGLKTVRTMIDRWAPPVENDTGAYVSFVAGRMGVDPDTVIDIHDYNIAMLMVPAIIAQENANFAYPASIVQSGLALAGIVPAGVYQDDPGAASE